MFELMCEMLSKIKKEQPLILNVTNLVTMDFIANGLLSVGAKPLMSHAAQEMEDLIGLASAVVINPGTIDDHFMELARRACYLADRFNKPIILDPVGAGASQYRTQFNRNLIRQFNIDIVRGNASEVMTLGGEAVATKGVDSLAESDEAIKSAEWIASKHDLTLMVSGKKDVVINQDKMSQFDYGSHVMSLVTGTGCLLSAIVASFRAVHANAFEAASAATIFYGMSGEVAASQSQLPGSFKTYFLDALHAEPLRELYERK